MRQIYLLFILSLLLSCGQSSHEIMSADEAVTQVMSAAKAENPASDSTPPPPPNASESPDINIEKKIIKSADLDIEVSNIEKAKQNIQENLKKNNSYIQSETFSSQTDRDVVSFFIKVPNENFDVLINSFSTGLGDLISKNVKTDDVTEEYTDVAIRLKNKMAFLDKYRDLLKQTNSTKDILEIQEKIRGLEEEIDSAEGRLKFIDDRVKYSTINMTIAKIKPQNSVTSKIGFGTKFVDSISQGWNNFVDFILGLVSFWPFLLIIPVLIFLWKKWKARRKE
ncbi:DUF4349 domain-containing protein [Soonwooa sp.]|uniref:DUF4349 domain-containing protein n=1 Tax=Soonwooa sp. TaxID=1938592 RepID=UPI002617FCC3|nr:DUF4349 domain-containing protein [Soonwooa sp.]